MSSEAITRNDLKAVLDEVLPVPEPTRAHEKFSLTVSGTAPTSNNQANFYFEATGEVHIALALWYANGIPAVGNALPMTIPQKYRPKAEVIALGILTGSSGSGQAPRAEMLRIRADGTIYISNFLSSYTTAKGFWIWSTYSVD